MVIIARNKKLLKVIAVSIFVVLIGFSLYRHMTNMQAKNHQQMVQAHNIRELEESFATTFLTSTSVDENVEIFDIGKGNVIMEVQVNTIALTEAKKYIQRITGTYVKVKALPDKGYIIKIPFKPTLTVKNQLLNDYNINSIDKIFIIFPQEDAPYLLVLDGCERPYFYYFEGDTDKLLRSLNFELIHNK